MTYLVYTVYCLLFLCLFLLIWGHFSELSEFFSLLTQSYKIFPYKLLNLHRDRYYAIWSPQPQLQLGRPVEGRFCFDRLAHL